MQLRLKINKGNKGMRQISSYKKIKIKQLEL